MIAKLKRIDQYVNRGVFTLVENQVVKDKIVSCDVQVNHRGWRVTSVFLARSGWRRDEQVWMTKKDALRYRFRNSLELEREAQHRLERSRRCYEQDQRRLDEFRRQTRLAWKRIKSCCQVCGQCSEFSDEELLCRLRNENVLKDESCCGHFLPKESER